MFLIPVSQRTDSSAYSIHLSVNSFTLRVYSSGKFLYATACSVSGTIHSSLGDGLAS